MKKLYIRTFGCQMNEYDSDKMADVLGAADGLVQKNDTPLVGDTTLRPFICARAPKTKNPPRGRVSCGCHQDGPFVDFLRLGLVASAGTRWR
jgi:hypothetical protein